MQLIKCSWNDHQDVIAQTDTKLPAYFLAYLPAFSFEALIYSFAIYLAIRLSMSKIISTFVCITYY